MDIKEGQIFSDEERKMFHHSIRRCNSCKHSNFTDKSCYRDPENPVRLNTYENAKGYVYLLKDRYCSNYAYKGDNDEQNSGTSAE